MEKKEIHNHYSTVKKKWNHYFWDFFMLFLAVTAGFLAENIRETSSENHKEKEYMRSFCRDLENDTSNFNSTLLSLRQKIPYYDSVGEFLHSPLDFDNKLSFSIYIKTNSDLTFTPIEPTFQQLKNSGNLRLIQNNLVLDSIQIYEGDISGGYLEQTSYVIEFNKRLLQLQEKNFDYTNLNKFLNARFSNTPINDYSLYNLVLTTNDSARIQELYNLFIGTKAAEIFYISSLTKMRSKAANLMAFIKKQYKL